MATSEGVASGNEPEKSQNQLSENRQKPGMAKNKPQWLLAGIGLLLLGTIAFFIYRQIGADKSVSLYAYYPRQATFFIEAQPGEALTRRILHWIETQEFKPGQAPGGEASKSAASHVGQSIRTPVSDEEIAQFRRALFDKFDTTFEPHLSIGLWPQTLAAGEEEVSEEGGMSKADKSQTGTLADGSALIILPLKQKMSFPELLTRFNGKQEHYKAQTLNHITYYTETKPADTKHAGSQAALSKSPNAFAVIDQKLFISNQPGILQNVILTLNDKKTGRKGGNVYDHPTTKKYLSLLDKHRDGTLIVNNTAYSQQLKALADKAPATLPAPLLKRVLLYANVTPLTLGALHIENDTLFFTDFLMPLNLTALGNQKLASEIKSLYAEKKPLAAAGFLPANTTFLLDAQSLDRWYDLYANHLMPHSQQAQLKQMGMLMTWVQLNWRSDLIGLFKGESAFASIDADPFPVLLLETNEKKQVSYNKILNVITSGKYFPAQHKEEQIGNVAVKTFSIPNRGQALSVGVISQRERQMIAFAEANAFEQLTPLAKRGKTPTGEKNAAAAESLAKVEDFKALTKNMPKNTALFLYSDVVASQQKLRQRLAQEHADAMRHKAKPEQATLSLMEPGVLHSGRSGLARRQNDAGVASRDWLSKLAMAVWAEPKGETEDLIQARVAFQLKPEQ